MNQIFKVALPTDEIIVVNDQSQDNTVNIIRKLNKISFNINLIHNINPGLSNALNLGVDESSHSWIARVDVDDCYSQNRLVSQFSTIESSTVAVFSDYIFMHNKKKIGSLQSAILPSAVSVSLISSQRTPHPIALFSKEAFIAAGKYRSEDYPAEDLSLWLRISRFGELKSVPEELLYYDINPGSVTSTKRKQMIRMKSLLLDEIGINAPDIISLINNLDETINVYRNFNYFDRRSMLLLGDLQMLHSRYGNKFDSRVAISDLIPQLNKVRIFSTLAAFSVEKIRRRSARWF